MFTQNCPLGQLTNLHFWVPDSEKQQRSPNFAGEAFNGNAILSFSREAPHYSKEVRAAIMNFCDTNDPQVQELAQKFRGGPSGPRSDVEFAIAAFNYVRDEIKYTILHNWSVPVSFTLATRKGNCGTKACLLVALFRAGGLKAEFTVERINTSRMFFIVPTFATGRCNNSRSIHFGTTVFLNGKWIRLDPTVDTALAIGLSGAVGDYFKTSFDGTSHGTYGGGKCDGDYQQLSTLDKHMLKKSRITRQVRECFNLSFEFARQYGEEYKTEEALRQRVEKHLWMHHADLVQDVLSNRAKKEGQDPSSVVPSSSVKNDSNSASQQNNWTYGYSDIQVPSLLPPQVFLKSKL